MVKMKVTTEGEDVDQPALGRDRRQGLREGHVLRDGRPRHPRAAEARGHGARQHRADREVHAELLLRPGRATRRSRAATTPPTTTSCSTRARRAGSARSASTTTRRPSTAATCRTSRCSASRSRSSSELLAEAHARRGADARTSTSCWRVGELFALVVYAQLMLENAAHLRRSSDDARRPDLRLHGARLLADSRSSCTASPSSTPEQMALLPAR